ncbi:hypothetical protein [Halobacterium sp. R2-5]|uniref:hypothetical protein n=1 Tax=Halobacterium sp. R2-5 TaxID=2715751 RepID=UPI001422FB7A|nr:hypothetical protein [Halobacterium sp. R2-5]NIB99978.1 hypothetical protein [Halobacterium sp. R2-5]
MDDDRLELLLTEYEQSGEEYRVRHQSLQNSYYLFVIGLSAFGIAAINSLDSLVKLGLLFSLGSIASFVLGFAIITHFVERQSAGVLRTRAEQAIEEYTNPEVNHRLNIQRPLSIQYHMIGQKVYMDDSGHLAFRDRDFSILFTRPDFSAKSLGQGIIVLSILQAIVGMFLLGSIFTI